MSSGFMKATGIGVLIVALVALVRLVIWLAPNPWESPAHPLITVEGSTTMYPLMAAIVQQFRHPTGAVRMTLGLAQPDGGFKIL